MEKEITHLVVTSILIVAFKGLIISGIGDIEQISDKHSLQRDFPHCDGLGASSITLVVDIDIDTN